MLKNVLINLRKYGESGVYMWWWLTSTATLINSLCCQGTKQISQKAIDNLMSRRKVNSVVEYLFFHVSDFFPICFFKTGC